MSNRLYLYATPTVESIRRLNNIFMSSPIHIDTNFKCCIDTVEDDYKIENSSVIKVRFKHIEVVTTFNKGIEMPETIANVEFLNYQSKLGSQDTHIAMCHSYLPSKSARHFFASIKDILIYKELPFDFSPAFLSKDIILMSRN